MSDIRETHRLLRQVYAENKDNQLVRDVYEHYLETIDNTQSLANKLWRLGEHRWAAAAETRAGDLETQARRHIEAIAERARATTDPVPVVDDEGEDKKP